MSAKGGKEATERDVVPEAVVMQQKLDKEYGGQSSLTTMLYDGVGTSAGDANRLRQVPRSASADERVIALQEANEIAVRTFLRQLQEKLQGSSEADSSQQPQKYTLFEGGSGKGAALQQYNEVFGDGLGSVVAVELSKAQFQKQRQHVEAWIAAGEHGFTFDNVIFIEDPDAYFTEHQNENYATLAEKYRYILVCGDVHEELARSQQAQLNYDAAVFIESIIHMDRQKVIAAVMDVLSEGGLVALTDVGVVSSLSWISNVVARLLDNRANVRPNGAEWWRENYQDSMVALVNKDDDQRETARQLASMLRDREMFQRVIKTFTEAGGMSTARAVRQYILDYLLFVSGAPIVTTYDVILQKSSTEKSV